MFRSRQWDRDAIAARQERAREGFAQYDQLRRAPACKHLTYFVHRESGLCRTCHLLRVKFPKVDQTD